MIELLNIGLAGCGMRVKIEGKILLMAGCSIKIFTGNRICSF